MLCPGDFKILVTSGCIRVSRYFIENDLNHLAIAASSFGAADLDSVLPLVSLVQTLVAPS